MQSVNKVILVGFVGKDPEVHYISEEMVVARFTLATDESYTKNGDKVKVTEWHNIVFWRNLAQVVEKYVRKGSLLYIEGKLGSRTWTDANGVEKNQTEISGTQLVMLDRKATADTTTQPPKPEPNFVASLNDVDDLPF